MKKSPKYVFGPVPSRRLGQSLGISPIPDKTCNYSCVYCQIGRTTHFTNKRQEFFPKGDILSEIKDALLLENKIDYITFVGEGEPTLNKNLGWLIKSCKEITDIPIAVITNGALLYNQEIRQELLAADIVLPTLDAINQNLFKKLNRPIKELKIVEIIDGMRAFRSEYQGQIWMEIMLVAGLNDDLENIKELKKVLDTIQCNRLYVNVPIRPPAEKWVKIPEKEKILRICEILEAENIAFYESVKGFHISSESEIKEQILKTTTRHPLREEQIVDMLDLSKEKCLEILQSLKEEKKIKKIIYNEKIFWVKSDTKKN